MSIIQTSAFKPLETFCVRLIMTLRKLNVIVYISAMCINYYSQ